MLFQLENFHNISYTHTKFLILTQSQKFRKNVLYSFKIESPIQFIKKYTLSVSFQNNKMFFVLSGNLFYNLSRHKSLYFSKANQENVYSPQSEAFKIVLYLPAIETTS